MEEFAAVIDGGEWTDVLGGLFDRTLALVRESHPQGEARDHIVSAMATLVNSVMSEAALRLAASGAKETDAYMAVLRGALTGAAGHASLQGTKQIPAPVQAGLLMQFAAALNTAHTMRRDI